MLTVALAFPLSQVAPSFAYAASTPSTFGSLIDGSPSVDRTIVINPKTKWVNANAGETIKFVVKEADDKDQSFTVHFDTLEQTVGNLNDVAPSGTLDHPIKVYVGDNPFSSD